jgi:hypothetical protein
MKNLWEIGNAEESQLEAKTFLLFGPQFGKSCITRCQIAGERFR